MWSHTLVILALGRQRLKDHKFKVSFESEQVPGQSRIQIETLSQNDNDNVDNVDDDEEENRRRRGWGL